MKETDEALHQKVWIPRLYGYKQVFAFGFALCVGSSICCGGECLCWEAVVQKSRASCPHNGPWGLLCYVMVSMRYNIYSPKCCTCLIWYPQHVRQWSIPSPTNVWWWYGHGQTAPMSPCWGEERRGSWSDQHLDRKEFAHLDSGFPLGSDGMRVPFLMNIDLLIFSKWILQNMVSQVISAVRGWL